MTLLDAQLWPELEWRAVSERLQAYDPQFQRRLAELVAQAVVRRVVDDDALSAELTEASTTDERLLEIEEELDRRVWAAQDDGDDDEYLRRFRRARGASAVIGTRLGSAADALARSLYEGRHALDDDETLLGILEDLTSYGPPPWAARDDRGEP